MPKKTKRVNVFYAYPSRPETVSECINEAINSLKNKRSIKSNGVNFRPWEDMNTGGKPLIKTIANEIGRSSVFACDLTYPNFNVTFELGFAIGKLKRIWISLNEAVADAPSSYKRIYYNMLGGLAYSAYTNNINLAVNLELGRPWVDLQETPLGDASRRRRLLYENPTLFYVRPNLDTNAVIKCVEGINRTPFKNALIADDPKEDPSPTLEWYASQLHNADAVLIQLLSEEESGFESNNLRAAFVGGLAHGLDKPLMMVAPTPFNPPADYQTLLHLHDTSEKCGQLVDVWLSSVTLPEPRRRRRQVPRSDDTNARFDLRSLSVGEYVAENEQWKLDPYFFETDSFFSALKGPAKILVGRRGTGKTANLFGIQGELNTRNFHVCTIKPVGYEIDGLVRVLNENMDRSERGYLIESLWKFLIFSELALSVSTEIANRPPYLERTTAEQAFIDFVDERRDSFVPSFSERLDKAVTGLFGVGDIPTSSEQRVKISELLHSGDIVRLREHLGAVLENRDKVAILLDNLDESWSPSHDIDRLSELLLGLLRVSRDLSNELLQQDHRRKAVNCAVTVFLRSDIFSLIQPQTAEQDKLPVERLYWDGDMLLNLLNQRLVFASNITGKPEEIWEKFFPGEVVGLPTSQFITSTVLLRPRDIIFLVATAISLAVNRGSETVTQNDFLEARKRYSDFVFKSVLAEDDPRKGKLESILFEFAGAPKTITSEDITVRLEKAGVEVFDYEFYIDLLCDINFLGVRTVNGEFRYSKDENERRTLREIARRLPLEEGKNSSMYEINVAFHQVLQIE